MSTTIARPARDGPEYIFDSDAIVNKQQAWA